MLLNVQHLECRLIPAQLRCLSNGCKASESTGYVICSTLKNFFLRNNIPSAIKEYNRSKNILLILQYGNNCMRSCHIFIIMFQSTLHLHSSWSPPNAKRFFLSRDTKLFPFCSHFRMLIWVFLTHVEGIFSLKMVKSKKNGTEKWFQKVENLKHLWLRQILFVACFVDQTQSD